MLVRMMVYLTTQSASLGAQESTYTTDLGDSGEKEGLSGAEGGPKKNSFKFEKIKRTFYYFNNT